MSHLIYVETSIPSFYFETRASAQIMPVDAAGDASHLAFASFYQCDRLLTWNCKHLANSNKFEHIEIINGRLGLRTPKIITPMQLLNDEET